MLRARGLQLIGEYRTTLLAIGKTAVYFGSSNWSELTRPDEVCFAVANSLLIPLRKILICRKQKLRLASVR
jgi:hypothetical protein